MWNLPNDNRQFGRRRRVSFPLQWLAAVQRFSSSLTLFICVSIWSVCVCDGERDTPLPLLSLSSHRPTDRLSFHTAAVKRTDTPSLRQQQQPVGLLRQTN